MDNDEDFERWLKEELSTLRNAPSGFSARLYARLLADADAISDTTRQRRFRPLLHWAVAATVALVAIGGSYWNREYQGRLAGQEARRNVLVALRITATTLDGVQRKLSKRRESETQ